MHEGHVCLSLAGAVSKNELLLQLSAGYSGNAVTLKRESPRHSGKLFNTHSTDKVKPER